MKNDYVLQRDTTCTDITYNLFITGVDIFYSSSKVGDTECHLSRTQQVAISPATSWLEKSKPQINPSLYGLDSYKILDLESCYKDLQAYFESPQKKTAENNVKDILKVNKKGYNILHYALINNFDDLTLLLLENIEPATLNVLSYSYLEVALAVDESENIIEKLINNVAMCLNKSSLKEGSLEIKKLLLKLAEKSYFKSLRTFLQSIKKIFNTSEETQTVETYDIGDSLKESEIFCNTENIERALSQLSITNNISDFLQYQNENGDTIFHILARKMLVGYSDSKELIEYFKGEIAKGYDIKEVKNTRGETYLDILEREVDDKETVETTISKLCSQIEVSSFTEDEISKINEIREFVFLNNYDGFNNELKEIGDHEFILKLITYDNEGKENDLLNLLINISTYNKPLAKQLYSSLNEKIKLLSGFSSDQNDKINKILTKAEALINTSFDFGSSNYDSDDFDCDSSTITITSEDNEIGISGLSK